MPKRIDLTGKIFDKLTVIEYDHTEDRKAYWKCQCSCGNTTIVVSEYLRNGDTRSCGCKKREQRRHLYEDLTGKIINNFTVLEYDHHEDNSKEHYWRCQCICGNIKILSTSYVNKERRTNICVCNGQKPIKDLSGQVFNNLTVLCFDYSKDCCSYWKCLCVCGNTKTVKGDNLKNGDCKSCGCIKQNLSNSDIDYYLETNNIPIKRIGDYSSYYEKFECLCLKCNIIWKSKFVYIKKNKGCPNCYRNNRHKNEIIVGETLTKLKIEYEPQKLLSFNNRKYFPDYWIPSYNLFIEYNGKQHYELTKFSHNISDEEAADKLVYQQTRDAELRAYCTTNNINLLEIDGRKYTYKKLKDFIIEYFANLKR
jgi:hypothetical protein